MGWGGMESIGHLRSFFSQNIHYLALSKLGLINQNSKGAESKGAHGEWVVILKQFPQIKDFRFGPTLTLSSKAGQNYYEIWECSFHL